MTAKKIEPLWFDVGEMSFLCHLPSMEYNRKFYFSVLNRIDPREAKTGTKMEALVEAFVDVCVVDAKGLPEGITPSDYLNDNWPDLLAIFTKAQQLAVQMKGEMEDVEKN